MKIAAVVIVYHPAEGVLKNIDTYHRFVDKVLIYDNTEHTPGLQLVVDALPKAEYVHDGQNAGLAIRLNAALRRLWAEGYHWLLTMDQDSHFAGDTLQQYLQCIGRFPQPGGVAMFGLQYSVSGGDGARHSSPCQYEEVENLITSGTVLNLQAAQKIGLFDEALFIDSIDHDYVIRARLLGFRVIQFTHLHLVHCLGREVYRASIKTLYLKKKKKIVHSPLRCYYMYRNMLYLEAKHRGQPAFMAGRLRKLVTGNLKANLFYGRQVLATIQYLLKARRHFSNNQMGKLGGR